MKKGVSSAAHTRARVILSAPAPRGLFTLILRQHRAATETVALMIMSKVLFRCFQLLHNGFMLRFHFRLTFSTRYIVLGRAQTRCACFKPTKHRGSALKVLMGTFFRPRLVARLFSETMLRFSSRFCTF